jgi:hypothetical protein
MPVFRRQCSKQTRNDAKPAIKTRHAGLVACRAILLPQTCPKAHPCLCVQEETLVGTAIPGWKPPSSCQKGGMMAGTAIQGRMSLGKTEGHDTDGHGTALAANQNARTASVSSVHGRIAQAKKTQKTNRSKMTVLTRLLIAATAARAMAAILAGAHALVLNHGTNHHEHASLSPTKSHGTEPVLLLGNVGWQSRDTQCRRKPAT